VFSNQARYGAAMSVRKRVWTTRLGERKEAWIVDYSDQDGDRHIQTFDKKKDADAYHDKVKTDIRTGAPHVAPSKSITVAEAADKWINAVKARANEKGTLAQYDQHARLHILPRLGKHKLAHLTTAKLESFRDDLVQNLSLPMARKVLTSFKSLLKVAKHAHTADLSVGRRKRSKRKLEVGRDFPKPEEIKRLIDAVKDDARMRALLLMAALCGLRASELRGVRWADVDLKSGELHVRQRADRYNRIGPPKSASGTRTIPLGPEVVAALKVWKLGCPKGEADLVFPSKVGTIMYHKTMLESLAPVMNAAGVMTRSKNPKYGLHAFRHFFASWCINRKKDSGRELPPKMVQELMGHSSIVITLDLYGHLFPRGDDRAELAEAETALFA
jgi:integrase